MRISLSRSGTSAGQMSGNIQGTRNWVMFVREHLMGQPYLTLVGKLETP